MRKGSLFMELAGVVALVAGCNLPNPDQHGTITILPNTCLVPVTQEVQVFAGDDGELRTRRTTTGTLTVDLQDLPKLQITKNGSMLHTSEFGYIRADDDLCSNMAYSYETLEPGSCVFGKILIDKAECNQ